MAVQRSLGRRLARVGGLALGGAGLLALAAAGAVWAGSEAAYVRKHPLPQLASPSVRPLSLAEGERLSRVYGCTDCHGPGLQGRLFHDDVPIGKIYGPNLTRVAQRYTDDQLRAAITHGVAADGRGLWVMPASTFAKMPEAELAAIIAYIRTQPVGGPPTRKSQMGPVARLGMVLGKFHAEPDLIARDGARLPMALSADVEAGRRLAAVACAECHGPALDGAEAPVKTPDLVVASAYDLDQFRRLMQTGASLTGRDLGLMSASAKIRFSALTEREVEQLHAYLVARAAKKTS